MPPRKNDSSSDSAAENLNPPPEEPVPYVSRADAEGLVAPQPVPPADDQVEVTMPDGTRAVVDKAYADALKANEGKTTGSVKNPPPDAAPDAEQLEEASRAGTPTPPDADAKAS